MSSIGGESGDVFAEDLHGGIVSCRVVEPWSETVRPAARREASVLEAVVRDRNRGGPKGWGRQGDGKKDRPPRVLQNVV
jgi:hypothetical protein